MSAFVVDQAHIDYLVQAGLAFAHPGDPLSWRALPDPPYPGGAQYEAWIAKLRENRRELRFGDATRVGGVLWAENHRSVSYRYSEAQITPPYVFDTPAARMDPVVALKAIDCLAYQSCETPDWEHTEAYYFLEALKSKVISRLPGYEAAPWGITTEFFRASRSQPAGFPGREGVPA